MSSANVIRALCLGGSSVALYGIILGTGMFDSVGAFLRFDTIVWPCVAAGMMFLLSRGTSRWVTPALLVSSVTFCGAVLSGLWGSGVSDHSVLAGYFPHSDSLSYVDGSLNLLLHGELTSITSRRPISPGIWAVLQSLLGGSVRGMLAAMVFLCACALVLPVREIIRSHGYVAGCVMFVALQLFYRRFIGTALSEHAGLLLGCVAFASLWRGVHARHIVTVAAGMLVLALALNTRAGAFFVVPALILWCGWAWKGTARFSWRSAVIAGVAAALGFGLNAALLRVNGTPGASMGNFSYTLYGLVHGGDWTQVIDHYPDVRELPELERYTFIYDKAMTHIKAHPFSLVTGALRSYAAFFFSFDGPFSFVRFALQQTLVVEGAAQEARTLVQRLMANPWKYVELCAVFASFGFFCITAILGIVRLVRQRPVSTGFLAMAWLGILASVPFAPPWDADIMRVYAATMPVMLVLPALGAGGVVNGWRRKRNVPVPEPRTPENSRALAVLCWGIVPLLCLSSLPFGLMGDHTHVDRTVDPGTTWSVRLLPGSRVSLPESSERRAWGQSVDPDRVRSHLGVLAWSYPHRAEEMKQATDQDEVLALAYEERTRTIRHVVLSAAFADMLSGEGGTAQARQVRPSEESMWWHLTPAAESGP